MVAARRKAAGKRDGVGAVRGGPGRDWERWRGEGRKKALAKSLQQGAGSPFLVYN